LGTTAGIEYRLLGAIEVGVNGHVLDIGGQKQRALLAILVLSANKPVSRDVLVDRLWGQHPTAGAHICWLCMFPWSFGVTWELPAAT